MSRTNPKAILVAIVLTPVVCCFVGVGVFLHVVVTMVKADEDEKADLRGQARTTADACRNLEQELASIEQRLFELRRKLLEEKDHADAVRQLEQELNRLLAQKAKVEDELTRLRLQLAWEQGALAKSKGDVQRAKDEAERTRQQVAQMETKVAEARTRVSETEKDSGNPLHSPDSNQEPRVNSAELQKQKTQRQTALDAAKPDSDQLHARLSGLTRTRQEKERTFELKTLKGTTRWKAPKPVYVECSASGVTIQPDGISFGTFADTDDQQKFLQLATRTGYTLFLVRPSGFASFHRFRDLVAAKANTSRTRIDYGYEPVNEDWNLIYPKDGG
jgi:hypothetical protein